MNASDLRWTEQQAAFFARREAMRSEMCACGHRRGDHQDDCAGCRRYHECRCLSFTLSLEAA